MFNINAIHIFLRINLHTLSQIYIFFSCRFVSFRLTLLNVELRSTQHKIFFDCFLFHSIYIQCVHLISLSLFHLSTGFANTRKKSVSLLISINETIKSHRFTLFFTTVKLTTKNIFLKKFSHFNSIVNKPCNEFEKYFK